MAKDSARIYSHISSSWYDAKMAGWCYRTQSPMHLYNAAIMADGKVLVEFGEIQRQYLQMAPLKGFIWKVSIISLLCHSLISLVLSIFDVFSRKSKKQTWTLKYRKNYSTWLVRFTMQVNSSWELQLLYYFYHINYTYTYCSDWFARDVTAAMLVV